MDQLAGVGFVSSPGMAIPAQGDDQETYNMMVREMFESQKIMKRKFEEMEKMLETHRAQEQTIKELKDKIKDLSEQNDQNLQTIQSELSKEECKHLVYINIDEFHDEYLKKVMTNPELKDSEKMETIKIVEKSRADAKGRRESKMRKISAGVGLLVGLGAAGAVTGAVATKLAIGSALGAAAVTGIGVALCLGTVLVGGTLFAAITYGGYRLYLKLHEGDKKSLNEHGPDTMPEVTSEMATLAG